MDRAVWTSGGPLELVLWWLVGVRFMSHHKAEEHHEGGADRTRSLCVSP